MNYMFYMHLAGSSNGETTTPGTTYNCDSGISQNNPDRTILNYNNQSTVVNRPLQHNDRYDTIWLYITKTRRPSHNSFFPKISLTWESVLCP